MNTSFKKIIAGVTAVTIVAMNMSYLTANAAGLAVASSIYDGTDTITVTVAGKDFTSDNIAAISVRTSAGVLVANVDVADVTNANGSFTLQDVVNLAGIAADTYSVAFTTVAGDIGAAIVNVGNDNQVTVTANVAPTLSFALNANSIAMGTLNNDGATYVEGTVTATTATNAQGGVVITFDATGLADTVINKSIGALVRGGTTATADTNDAYKFAIGGAVGGGSTNVAASANAVYSIGTPVASTATVVHVGAVAGGTTESGNYGDTLTFNVTGTF